jgi:hypothetical protein
MYRWDLGSHSLYIKSGGSMIQFWVKWHTAVKDRAIVVHAEGEIGFMGGTELIYESESKSED